MKFGGPPIRGGGRGSCYRLYRYGYLWPLIMDPPFMAVMDPPGGTDSVAPTDVLSILAWSQCSDITV